MLLVALSLVGCSLDDTSRYLVMIAALFLLGALGEVIFARTHVPDVVWLILAGIGLNASGAVRVPLTADKVFIACSWGQRFRSAPLPPALRRFTAVNPVFYVVDAVRFAMLGISDAPPWAGVTLLAAGAAVAVATAYALLRSGWRLRG